MVRRALLAGGALLVACNISSGDGLDPSARIADAPDASSATTAGTTTIDGGLPAPTGPTVATFGGAPMSTVDLVTVLYNGEPDGTTLTRFGNDVLGTPWWAAVTGEYGIHAGTSTVLRTPSLPVDGTVYQLEFGTDDLQNLLAGMVTAGQFPTPTAHTLPIVFLPPSVSFVTADGRKSCTDLDRYHGVVSLGGVAVPFGVVPRCTKPGESGAADALTYTASRLLVDIATDPRPWEAHAYLLRSASRAALVGATATFPELATSCAAPFAGGATDSSVWREDALALTRSWSAASALAGNNPCVPIYLNEPYVDVAPVDAASQTIALAVGESTTFKLRGIGNDGDGAWDVDGADLAGGSLLDISISPPRITLRGETDVKVTLKAKPAQGSSAFYALRSHHPSGRVFSASFEITAKP